jgi:hypothetical protein
VIPRRPPGAARSGTMTPGAELRWDWEMHGLSTRVFVKEVDDNRRILFEWGDDNPTPVELERATLQNAVVAGQVTPAGLGGHQPLP